MAKKKRALRPEEPIIHDDHKLRTRRDFLRHGFITGSGLIIPGGVFSLFSNPRQVMAEVSPDLDELAREFSQINCTIGGISGEARIPMICFDLAGGAGISSNVLVGRSGGQLVNSSGSPTTLDTAGYVKMGIPGDQTPGQNDAAPVLPGTNGDFTDTSLGLAFHSDSGFLRGIFNRAPAVYTSGQVDGTVIAARSDNDTGNNPHNPMYGIARANGQGTVVTLIGSRSSDSGGNSMSPASLLDAEIRPTKVDRPSDVTGMVDVGNLNQILGSDDVVAVMEAIARISHKKTRRSAVNTNLGVSRNEMLKELVSCGYIKAADITERFVDEVVDPGQDPDIVGPGGIFNATEFNANTRDGAEYRKTASVMKMVISGYAGAGTITMGGYDYHTGERGTGEDRDFRAGECIGACLEYASRFNGGTPLMIYVFSDGSVSSNGRIDTTDDGRNKPEWTGDNSSTACSFFLFYNPGGPVPTFDGSPVGPQHRQLGYYTADGSVVTTSSSAANNVIALAHTAILNFMAANGDIGPGNFGNFTSRFVNANGVPTHGISNLAGMTTFGRIRP